MSMEDFNPVKKVNPDTDSQLGGKNEVTPKPEKLYRGFVIPVESLSVETLYKTLTPSQESGEDGNERGIYMSDNLSMVEQTNYSAASRSAIEVPQHDSGRGVTNKINLPGCGVVIEVDTKELNVREPAISGVWQGHYNNGFQGKEWVADEISANQFVIKKLILATGVNDNEKFTVDLPLGTKEELEAAIVVIRERYAKKKTEAEEFKAFLNSVPNLQQLNGFSLKRKWEQHRATKNNP